MRRCRSLTVIALAALASVARAERPRLPVSGVWQFRTDPKKAGVTERWFAEPERFERSVRVPGCWEASGVGDETPDARHGYLGWGWYGRRFEAPASWAGQRVFLHVGAVHRTARVWVNGVEVGWHIGYVTAFEFDVTDCLGFGRPNTLTILVDSEQHPETDGLAGCIDTYDFVKWGGIYRDVWLEARADAWLENLFVRSEKGGTQARVTAGVRGTDPGGLTFRCRLTPVGGGQGYQASGPVSVLGDATVADVTVLTAGAKLWSPEHPELYVATAELLRGGRVADTVSTRCGLREIETRGNDIYLNGRRILLRGYGDDCCFPLTVCPPADKGFYLKRFRVARDYGFIYVRHHSHVPLQEYFDAADEMGFLIQPELPIAYENHIRDATPAAKDLFRSQWRDIILQYRNHPSVFAWCMGNEMGSSSDIAPDLYASAKQLDPTRPVNDTDGLWGASGDPTWSRPTLDIAHVQFNEQTIPWGPNAGKYELPSAPVKPVTIHEMGNFVAFYDPRDAARYTGLVKPSWLAAESMETPFDYPSHREPHARMWYVRQMGAPWSLEWETAPVPANTGARVAFVFTAATGFLTEPSGSFTLHLDGSPLISFNCPESSRGSWRSADGRAELVFHVKQNGIDQFGVMVLVVPAEMVTRGRPCRLRVTGSDAASRRWFGLYAYTDTIGYETSAGGLPGDVAGMTVVNGFARLVKWVSAQNQSVAQTAALRGTTDLLATFVANSRKLQALCHRMNIEAARMGREIDGYALWLLQDYWRGGQGLLNQFYEPKGFTAEAARQCNGPTVVLLRRARCALQAGEPIEGTVVVSHFGEERLARPTVGAELVDVAMQTPVAGSGERRVDPVPSGEVRDLGALRLDTPKLAHPAKLELRLTLTDGGRSWSNQWDFWVFPEAEPANSGQLTVTEALTTDVLAQLEAGERVLLVSPKAFPGDPLRFKSPWWFPGEGDSNLGTIVRTHPALGGFPHEGWCDLEWFEMIEGATAVHHVGPLARVEPIIQAIDLPMRHLTRSLLFELQVGQGKLLATSLDLSPEVLRQSPAARYLKRCLTRYALGDQFHPQARMTRAELEQCVTPLQQ